MGIFKPLKPTLDLTNSISSGLVFAIEMYEGTGSTSITESVTSVTGTLNGSTKPAWNKNTYGYDLTFNGSTSYALFADSATLDLSGNEITLEALVYPTTVGLNQQIFDKAQQDGSHPSPFFMYCLQDDGSGNAALWMTTSSNGGGIRTTGAAFTTNAYNHIVGTYKNGTGGIVYKNGVAGSTNTSVAGTISTSNGGLYIGSNGQFSEVWNGRIVYCRIWNRALTAAEVLSLYQNPWRIYLPMQQNNYQFVSAGDGISVGERIR